MNTADQYCRLELIDLDVGLLEYEDRVHDDHNEARPVLDEEEEDDDEERDEKVPRAGPADKIFRFPPTFHSQSGLRVPAAALGVDQSAHPVGREIFLQASQAVTDLEKGVA